MKNLRSHLQSASLGVLFGYFALTWFVLTYAFAVLLGSARVSLTETIGRAVGALVFGGVMTLVAARQRRRSGGVENLVAINAAVRTGTVPEDAEPSIWVPALDERRRQNVRSTWLSPVIFGVFTVLGVVLALSEPQDAVLWGLTAFMAFAAVFCAFAAARQVRKIDALLAQLRPAGTTAAGRGREPGAEVRRP